MFTAALAVAIGTTGGIATASGTSSGAWPAAFPLPVTHGTVTSQSSTTAVVRSTDPVAVVLSDLDGRYLTQKLCTLRLAVNKPKDYLCNNPATSKTDEVYFTLAALDPPRRIPHTDKPTPSSSRADKAHPSQCDRPQAQRQQRTLTERIMTHAYGRWLVGLIGLIVITAGLAMIAEGARRKFEKDLRMNDLLGTCSVWSPSASTALPPLDGPRPEPRGPHELPAASSGTPAGMRAI